MNRIILLSFSILLVIQTYAFAAVIEPARLSLVYGDVMFITPDADDWEPASVNTPFSEGDWAELLDISTKSLQRYKQDSRQFKPLQSEKIIEMAEVTNVGVETFGDLEKFKLWLDTPNFPLGQSAANC